MSRRSSSRISTNPPTRSSQGLQVSPSDPVRPVPPDSFVLPQARRTRFVVLLAVGLGVGVLLVLLVGLWQDSSLFNRPWGGEDRTSDGVAEGRRLCDQFQMRKNAGDPLAKELLAALPEVPAAAISQQEAERIQADCFLHQDVRIVGIRPDSSGRFVLATEGNVSAPTLQVRTATGVDRIQRTMFRPDLIVEVREGKIHGIRAEMHSER